jgi:hypothetical protein
MFIPKWSLLSCRKMPHIWAGNHGKAFTKRGRPASVSGADHRRESHSEDARARRRRDGRLHLRRTPGSPLRSRHPCRAGAAIVTPPLRSGFVTAAGDGTGAVAAIGELGRTTFLEIGDEFFRHQIDGDVGESRIAQKALVFENANLGGQVAYVGGVVSEARREGIDDLIFG